MSSLARSGILIESRRAGDLPMTDLESYRTSHLGKGVDYHAEFTRNPRRALMWRLEQRVLLDIFRRYMAKRAVRHLDFACGTGRVVSLLSAMSTKSVGIDVSPSMLDVARSVAPAATFIQADMTKDSVLEECQFDFITAFRFFPNAEPSLRHAAMSQLVRRLSPGGVLVFNNHCNAGGLNRRLVRVVRRREGRLNDMTKEECEELIALHGLEIAELQHLGILPDYETHPLRPRWAVAAIERIASRLPLASIAENHIYVCGHSTVVSQSGTDLRCAALD